MTSEKTYRTVHALQIATGVIIGRWSSCHSIMPAYETGGTLGTTQHPTMPPVVFTFARLPF
jgi:hypothetical protein